MYGERERCHEQTENKKKCSNWRNTLLFRSYKQTKRNLIVAVVVCARTLLQHKHTHRIAHYFFDSPNYIHAWWKKQSICIRIHNIFCINIDTRTMRISIEFSNLIWFEFVPIKWRKLEREKKAHQQNPLHYKNQIRMRLFHRENNNWWAGNLICFCRSIRRQIWSF